MIKESVLSGEYMKYLAWFGGLLVTLTIVLYVVAFTPFGNGLIKPMVESKISKKAQRDVKLTTFRVNMSEIEMVLELSKGNKVSINGDYSLLSKTFDILYDVQISNLESLVHLTTKELKGRLFTDGRVRGDLDFMEIDGRSDIAESESIYHVELTNLEPTSIVAKIKEAKLSSLLDMTKQRRYASGDINLHVNFKNIKPGELDGYVKLETSNGALNSEVMKKEFDVTIPATLFNMGLNAKLKGDDVNYNYLLASNLFKIESSGNIVPKPFKSDVKYSLSVKDLAVLKPVTSLDVRGALNLSGTLKGSKENLVLKGKSDIADSNTEFKALIKEFKPESLEASVKGMKLEKLLHMLKQPHYADGRVFVDAKLEKISDKSINGSVVTLLSKGLFDSKYLSREYKFDSTMPRTNFEATVTSKIDANLVESKVDFNSDILNLDTKKTLFDTKNSLLKSDYTLKVPDLSSLYFISGRDMRGSIVADGELVKEKDLDITMHTEIADGKLDAKVHNSDLHVDLRSMQTTALLRMLKYPDIFGAHVDAQLDYDLSSSKGKLSSKISEGNFVNNHVFNLIKKYTKFDMYRESFRGVMDAKINKENMLIDLELNSKQAYIKTKNTKLNTKTKMIDSDLKIRSKDDTLELNLKGDINSPKLTIDLEELMRSQTGKRIEKEINKLFKKLF